jgi:hypothetical protein
MMTILLFAALWLAAMIVADRYLWAADAVDGWIERRER